MTAHIALLRAINVGGRNRVAMSDLRRLCESLGLTYAKTYLQSGNVVFRSVRGTGAALERQLAAVTADRLEIRTHYFVRSAAEWKAVIAGNPFPEEAKRDPGHLVVVFMKASPAAAQVRALQDAIVGPEIVRCLGKQLYAVYPAGIGRSKLTNALIEDTLGLRATARNWNTVLRLAELGGAQS